MKLNERKGSNKAIYPDFDFQIDIFRVISFKSGYRFKMHNHRRLELNYVVKGSCLMMLENQLVSLKENSGILIFPESKHDFFVDSKTGIKIAQIEFRMDESFWHNISQQLSKQLSFLQELGSNSKGFIRIPNSPAIKSCMERIISENKLKKHNYEMLCKLYLLELTLILCRQQNMQLDAANDPIHPVLKTALNTMHQKYNTEVSVHEIAQTCNVSERYLRQLFSKYMESSPIEYLNTIRITKAAELLTDKNIPIKDIAYSTGYSTPQYFSRIFKKQFGISPQQYRNILFAG